MRSRLAALLAVAALALGSCGTGDSDEPSSVDAPPESADIEVALVFLDTIGAIEEVMDGITSSDCEQALDRLRGGRNAWLDSNARNQVTKTELVFYERTEDHVCSFLGTFVDVPTEGADEFRATFNGEESDWLRVDELDRRRLVISLSGKGD